MPDPGFHIAETIHRNVEEIFAFLSDLTNMTMWDHQIENVEKKTAGTVRRDSIFIIQTSFEEHFYKVIHLIPHQKITFEIQRPDQKYIVDFEIIAKGNFSGEVIYRCTLDPSENKFLKLLPTGVIKDRVLAYLTGRIHRTLKPGAEESLTKLKTQLETRSVVLQNGRRSRIVDEAEFNDDEH